MQTAHSTPHNATHSNADPHEIARFAQLANQWWNPQGALHALHAINPLRLQWIASHTPLAGSQVLDIGCGGGILSGSLARAGAEVTAIDLSPDVIEIARLHLLESALTVDYRLLDVEALAAESAASFDLASCMEMLEHVPDPASTIRACATLVKPGGHVFFSTLNRNLKAYLMAVVGAEYVLNLLPKGTHHYKEFIRPSELAAWLRDAGLQLQDVSGLAYEPWRQRARLSTRTDVNYLACAVKP